MNYKERPVHINAFQIILFPITSHSEFSGDYLMLLVFSLLKCLLYNVLFLSSSASPPMLFSLCLILKGAVIVSLARTVP